MIDKYQVYALYKVIKKMWNAKRFNTLVFMDFFDDTLENYIIAQYINAGRGTEYMSNYAIKLVNEMNCGITDIEHWTMYVMMKCLRDRKCPALPDINGMNKLKDCMVFTNRAVLKPQIAYVRSLMEEQGTGLNEFMDTGFSLYRLDDKQQNEAYRMYLDGRLDPEFYIQGYRAGKFTIDMDSIKDVDYKRFITFTKMILKLEKEISDKNVNV